MIVLMLHLMVIVVVMNVFVVFIVVLLVAEVVFSMTVVMSSVASIMFVSVFMRVFRWFFIMLLVNRHVGLPILTSVVRVVGLSMIMFVTASVCVLSFYHLVKNYFYY